MSKDNMPSGASTHLSRVLHKIESGVLATGVVVTTGDATVTEVLAGCGHDLVWIDMEHSALDRTKVNQHIVAARGLEMAPFVRVPWNDPVLAKPIMEMGPAAVVFPFVNSAEDAARAVASCRYPPDGTRGFGPLRADGYGAEPLDDYLERSRTEPWVVLQIEHVDAVRNLDEICAVPGIGSLLVGPFDLSASTGCAGQMHHPDVVALMDEIARVANEHGVHFGAFCVSTDERTLGDWITRGVSWLALDTDVILMKRAAGEAMERMRTARG